MLGTTMTRHADSQTQKKILDLFAKTPRTRLTPPEIQRRAGFERNDLQLIINALRELSRDGRLVRLKKNHYMLPERQNLVTGRVQAHPDGYGFLIPAAKHTAAVYF